MEGASASERLRHHSTGLGMGAGQPGDRERPMTDRTTTDQTMTDPDTRLSHLELDQPDKTFLDSNELVINMGPQHPATPGVLRVILKLDGGRVLGPEWGC